MKPVRSLLFLFSFLLSVTAFAQFEVAVGDTSGPTRNSRARLVMDASGNFGTKRGGSGTFKRLALYSEIIAASQGGIQTINGLSPTNGAVTLGTDKVAETNGVQYFTLARARGAFTVSGPLGLNTSTGALTFSGTPADVQLGRVNNTNDLEKPISTLTQTALNGKEPTIPNGSTAQYIRGDKSLATLDKTAVNLGNLDNTSDINKPISTLQQQALNLKKNADLSVATYAAMNALTVAANSYTDVTVTADEQYGETFSEYRVYALNDGVTHAKKRTIISEK